MTDFIANLSQYQPVPVPPWLHACRQKAGASWLQNTMPTRKTEQWKYLSLRPLLEGDYISRPLNDAGCSLDELKKIYAIPELAGVATLVFVNGVYCEALSETENLPEGVILERFAVMEESSDGATLLNSVIDSHKHLFSQLNLSQLEDGFFLNVSAKAQVKAPIHLVHVVTPQPKPYTVSPRLLVRAQPQSQVSVVEHFCSTQGLQNSFMNSVTELIVEDNARLDYYRMQLEQEQVLHIGGVHAVVARDGMLNSFHLSLGSELQRLDFTVTYRGEGGKTNLNGVYLPRGNQQVDCHTCIEHAVPNCTTNEVFRGIVSDSAKAVFNGRIHIHPDAQKTLAQLSNKNLLTSNKAEVDTKPELEIYADDVQCAHGATVAQVDNTALHYFMTRGVSRDEALVMLSFGFINELIEKIQNEAIANYLRPILAKRFAKNAELLRHIV